MFCISWLMIAARHETLSTIYSCTFFVLYIYIALFIQNIEHSYTSMRFCISTKYNSKQQNIYISYCIILNLIVLNLIYGPFILKKKVRNHITYI